MSDLAETLSERLLLRAHPHLWGPGRVHLLADNRTFCGRHRDNCPGEPFRGPVDAVTCQSCLKAIGAKAPAGAQRDPERLDGRATSITAAPTLPALEGEQVTALAALERFLAGNRQCFLMQGLAGTGKTTVLASLARRRHNASLLAPTGKAASVLARKTGSPATTLHKLLYRPETDLQGNLIGFRRRFEPGQLADEIALIDEASMIGTGLAADLLATGIRIIASGDPGQLPPVEEAPYFTAADFTLYDIRRQAAGSPIIRQAHAVRHGQSYQNDGEAFRVIDRREAARRIDEFDAVLCWRNTTRHRLNEFIRHRRHGYSGIAMPMPGEPIMCLENHASGMMNGEIFIMRELHPKRGVLLDLADRAQRIEQPWFEWLHPNQLQPRRRAAFALGYAITVHKAQGSEWPHVLVLDEFAGADRARWTYTAITRAAKTVCIVPNASKMGT
jgi:exodeoxyribonuclease-5